MTTPTADTRPLRCDAERNRARLLDAAAGAFAEHGLEVSISEIARRAGLGHGTVFRHFPSKDHLLVAILERKLARLHAVASASRAIADPWEAISSFLTTAVREYVADRALLQSVSQHDGDGELHAQLAAEKQAVLEEVGHVVQRAREAGVVRADLQSGDIPIIVAAASQCACLSGHGHHDDPPARLLELLLDGLRPRPAAAG